MKWLVLLLFAVIIVLALVLRLYRIDEYMTFLGDEGRDAIIVNDLVKGGNIPFIGPPTSVGNMYLGPFYYYMMAVPFYFTDSNPVSASVMVAVLGVASIGMVFYLSLRWFGLSGAVVASLLYAISPVAIEYSRFSWNPNPTPFFVLLTAVGLWKIHQRKNLAWLLLVGFGTAGALQMHYLAILFLPVVIIVWFLELRARARTREKLGKFVLASIAGLLIFVALNIPLLLFDMKHNFLNMRALMDLLTNKDSVFHSGGVNPFIRLWDVVVNNLVSRFIAGQIAWLAVLVATVLILWILLLLKGGSDKSFSWQVKFLLLWMGVGFLGLMVYKGSVYDHYLGFLFPAIFLMLGGFVEYFGKKKWLVAVVVLLVLGFVNFRISPLFREPNRQLTRTQEVVKFIIGKAGEERFNFALIAERNYDSAYKFYLEKYGRPVGLLPFDKTEQLFVVCEDRPCAPVGHPKHEIAAFGWTKEVWREEVGGVEVVKLIPNPDEPSE